MSAHRMTSVRSTSMAAEQSSRPAKRSGALSAARVDTMPPMDCPPTNSGALVPCDFTSLAKSSRSQTWALEAWESGAASRTAEAADPQQPPGTHKVVVVQYQGAVAFSLWLRLAMPVHVVRVGLDARLGPLGMDCSTVSLTVHKRGARGSCG